MHAALAVALVAADPSPALAALPATGPPADRERLLAAVDAAVARGGALPGDATDALAVVAADGRESDESRR